MGYTRAMTDSKTTQNKKEPDDETSLEQRVSEEVIKRIHRVLTQFGYVSKEEKDNKLQVTEAV